jgi:hypothetical protein
MNEDDLYEYFGKLWAMLIWGNKRYAIDQIIKKNGLDLLLSELGELLWGSSPIENRWDRFREGITGVGPAMMSELLCHVNPADNMMWNRRVETALELIGVTDQPTRNYQKTGAAYARVCELGKEVGKAMKGSEIEDTSLLAVDYFFWKIIGTDEAVTAYVSGKKPKISLNEPANGNSRSTTVSLHNEIRDKLAEIGQWLGFVAEIEVPVAHGAKVDTVWSVSVGNMGKIIYAFEVQTQGSIDSLALNLMKAMNNPAVQGIVAVSDSQQIEKIKKEVSSLPNLAPKLRYWNYDDVLRVHAQLEEVNEAINKLGLVPAGF